MEKKSISEVEMIYRKYFQGKKLYILFKSGVESTGPLDFFDDGIIYSETLKFIINTAGNAVIGDYRLQIFGGSFDENLLFTASIDELEYFWSNSRLIIHNIESQIHKEINISLISLS